MTFLLFLASLAVIEYILSRDRPDPTQVIDNKTLKSMKPQPVRDVSSGLLSLAEAIEERGRGQEVGTADHEQPTHKPGVDGV